MEIERGNTSCLYLHVLISTEPNNNNNNKTGAIRSVWNASVWLWTWKNAPLQIGGRSVAFLKKHPKHASILSEPWSSCISEIPKVAMETHHYIELVLLWTVMWKILTFPFLHIACGVTNNTRAGMCALCIKVPISKCLLLQSPGSINQWLKVVSFGDRLGFSFWLLVLKWWAPQFYGNLCRKQSSVCNQGDSQLTV